MKGKPATGVERIVLNASIAGFRLSLLSDPKWYALKPVSKSLYMVATMVGVWLHVKVLPATFNMRKLGLLLGQNGGNVGKAVRECVAAGFLTWEGRRLGIPGIEVANRKVVWIDHLYERLGKDIGVEWLLNDRMTLRIYPRKESLTPFVKRPKWNDAGEPTTDVYRAYIERERARPTKRVYTPEQIRRKKEKYWLNHPDRLAKKIEREARRAAFRARVKARQKMWADKRRARAVKRYRRLQKIEQMRQARIMRIEKNKRLTERLAQIRAEIKQLRLSSKNADKMNQNNVAM